MMIFVRAWWYKDYYKNFISSFFPQVNYFLLLFDCDLHFTSSAKMVWHLAGVERWVDFIFGALIFKSFFIRLDFVVLECELQVSKSLLVFQVENK
jgi:hypothetical protein